MLWPDVRKACPHQWLVIEALEAHTTLNNQRKLDGIAIIDTCSDGDAVVQRYRQLHQQYPSALQELAPLFHEFLTKPV